MLLLCFWKRLSADVCFSQISQTCHVWIELKVQSSQNYPKEYIKLTLGQLQITSQDSFLYFFLFFSLLFGTFILQISIKRALEKSNVSQMVMLKSSSQKGKTQHCARMCCKKGYEPELWDTCQGKPQTGNETSPIKKYVA